MTARNAPFQGPPGYKFLADLGVGSYGEVFLVRRPVPGGEEGHTEDVAIKRITDYTNSDYARGPDQIGFCRRICREVCSLVFFGDCRYVVEAYDLYLSPDKKDLFMVMPFYNMSMLHLFTKPEHLALKQHLGEKHIQWMMCQVLCGLYEMHESQVMHRDMTLGNLLMNSTNFECVIADFGLSRVQIDAGEAISLEVVSLPYRSPEIILGCKPYTNALDVWSCGVILAQLLTKSSFLQLPDGASEDVVRQLWCIMDEFAGYPTLEELDVFEKDNASRLSLDVLRRQHSRCAKIKALAAEVTRLQTTPVAAAATAPGDTCEFCGDTFAPLVGESPDIAGLPLSKCHVGDPANASAIVHLHGNCVKPWVARAVEQGNYAPGAPGVGCSLCQALLDDGPKSVFLTHPVTETKFPFHVECVLPWNTRIMQLDHAHMRTLVPRPLPEPQDVGKKLQCETVLPDPQTGELLPMSEDAADVIRAMLVFSPGKRATIKQVLQMKWWAEDPPCRDLIEQTLVLTFEKCPDEIEKMDLPQLEAYIASLTTM